MKRIIIKLRLLSALFILLGITKIAYSQTPTYQLYFTNVQHPANNIVVWDAYLLRTGTTPLQLASIQFGFGYDISILNGGTLTASIDSGFSDLPVAMQPVTIQSGTVNYTAAPVPVGQTHRYINVAARGSIGLGNGPLISNADGGCGSKGTRIGRFRITNTVPFAPNSRMNQVFSQAVGSGRTRTAVFAYVGALNTEITVVANHFSYNVPSTCDQNILLNSQLTNCTFTASGTTSPASCAGTPDGTAEITLQGQWSGLPGTYTVDGGAATAYSTNPFTITGLSQGNHTVIVAEGNCITNAVFLIVGSSVNASQSGGTAVSCNVNNDGTASITLNAAWSGIPGTYKVDGGTATPFSTNPFTITGLSAGNHNVVINVGGCITSPVPVFVEYALNILSTALTPVRCNTNDGTAVVTLSGSLSGLPGTYTVDGGVPNNYSINPITITGLTAGNHAINVSVGSCTKATSFTTVLDPILNVTYDTTNSSYCNGNSINNGTITVSVTGGVAPYTYSVNGGTTTQASNLFTGLGAGNYVIKVIDATGCFATKNTSIIEQGLYFSPRAYNVSACDLNPGYINMSSYGNGVPPYTFSLDGTNYQSSYIFAGLAAGSYTCYLRDATGCIATQTISISTDRYRFDAYTTYSSSCINDGSVKIFQQRGSGGRYPFTFSLDGINYQASNIFNNLAPGSYTAYIKDASGCTGTIDFAIGSLHALYFNFLVTQTSSCVNDGTIRLTGISGGIGPYTYSLDGINYQSNYLFTGLGEGSYTYYVKDSKGCTAQRDVYIFTNKIFISPQVTAAGSCAENNGSIRLFFTGGVGPFTYSLDGTTYQAGNFFSGLSAGTYTGFVKDSKGCTGQKDIVVGPINCAPPVANNAKGLVTSAVTPSVSSLQVQVYPNPGIDEFTLVLSGYTMNEKVSVIVTDIMGRKVYFSEGTGKQQYKFGRSFIAGLYNLQVIQGTVKKSVKLVKE